MILRHTLIFVLSCIIYSSYAGTNSQPIVCSQPYARCTSASCVPDPRHDDYAICTCDVTEGKNVGYTSCPQRNPIQGPFKARQILAAFSFEQLDTHKKMTCPKGKPWTNCVDAPCTINPLNPKEAICSCLINDFQPFVTFGGSCKTDTCDTGFWSGMTLSSSTALQDALAKSLNLGANLRSMSCIGNRE